MDAGSAACGAESAQPVKASDAYAELTTELKSTTVAMQAVGATRRLDVSALGDAHFFYRYGNEKDARDAILTRLNNVDGIYSSQLAIEIHVGTLSVPDAEHDQLSLATDPKSLLRDLANLRKRSAELNSQGVTHLFTDRELDGSTIGIAYLDSLCDKQRRAEERRWPAAAALRCVRPPLRYFPRTEHAPHGEQAGAVIAPAVSRLDRRHARLVGAARHERRGRARHDVGRLATVCDRARGGSQRLARLPARGCVTGGRFPPRRRQDGCRLGGVRRRECAAREGERCVR
jgi:hypothetical protein